MEENLKQEENEQVVSSTTHLVDDVETDEVEIDTEEQLSDEEITELLSFVFGERTETMKQMKFEKKLIKNGFKIKHFQDDSGYWFSKKFKFPVFGKIKVLVEPDNNIMYFELQTEDQYLDYKVEVYSWKECKKILKKHNLL